MGFGRASRVRRFTGLCRVFRVSRVYADCGVHRFLCVGFEVEIGFRLCGFGVEG